MNYDDVVICSINECLMTVVVLCFCRSFNSTGHNQIIFFWFKNMGVFFQ